MSSSLSPEQIEQMLTLQEQCERETLEEISAQMRRQEEKHENPQSHPRSGLGAGKHLANRRPAGYVPFKGLQMERSDGINVGVQCPVCGSSDFGSEQKFLSHLVEDEQLPLFESDEDMAVVQQIPDFVALEFGHVLDEYLQSAVGRQRVRKLVESGLDPNTQLYIEKPKEQHELKFLRKRAGKDLDGLLAEMTQ